MSKRRSTQPGHEQRSSSWILPAMVGLLVGAGATWYLTGARTPSAHQPSASTPSPAAASSMTAPLNEIDRAALGEFVREYFTSWSRQDIDAYGRCFHPNARIWFEAGVSLGLPEFLDSQRKAHGSSPVPLTEDALEWDGNVHNGLANVRVHWELHRGPQNVRGYDFFTLAKVDGRWQIVALVFNEE